MKAIYDVDTDSLSIVLNPDAAVAESDENKPGVILDYDAAGNLVSLEILDASKRVGDARGIEFEIVEWTVRRGTAPQDAELPSAVSACPKRLRMRHFHWPVALSCGCPGPAVVVRRTGEVPRLAMAIGRGLHHSGTEQRSTTVDTLESTNNSLLGIGLYTVPEASRLTGIPQARLRRWLRGYTYRTGGEAVEASGPVWQRQLAEIDGTLGLGFLDLMEARFVDAFRKADVPWRVIRLCAERARELVEADHPFSSQRFRTDGRTIFAEIVDRAGEAQLLDLAKSQFAFARVISPSLYAEIEFSERDMPVRWWPLGRQTPIVLDPARSFGQPIVSTGGIPTAVLADAVAAEGSVAKVARLYQVPPQSVHAAMRFEQRAAERLAA